jgi:hypothetical protein
MWYGQRKVQGIAFTSLFFMIKCLLILVYDMSGLLKALNMLIPNCLLFACVHESARSPAVGRVQYRFAVSTDMISLVGVGFLAAHFNIDISILLPYGVELS